MGDIAEHNVSEFSNKFSPATVSLNENVMRLRAVAYGLAANQQTIDGAYSKISMGGIVAENRRLIQHLASTADALAGNCWAQIADESSAHTQLDVQQWLDIGSAPPDWLRRIFESATLLTTLPDEASMAEIAKSACVLVLRDPGMGSTGALLPQAAAIMPKGFLTADVRLWWPWVMGGRLPVWLAATDDPFVLQEYSVNSLQEAAAVLEG